MSIQTNFRAQDMLGVKKPVVKKAAPKPVTPVRKVEPVVAPEAVVTPELVQDPVTDEKNPL